MTLLERGAGAAFRGPYGLSEDEDLFRRTVHEFAEHEIVPVAHELDESEEFPRVTVGKMAELGLMGLLVPEEFGGAGADTMHYALAMEEISWADASHSVVMSVNNSLVCEPIVRFGNREQKERYLPALAQGGYVGAYCLTEPGSGSDASNMSTRAERIGDEFVLNGTKAWITNGGGVRRLPRVRGHQRGRGPGPRNHGLFDAVRDARAARRRQRKETRHSRVEHHADLLRGLPRTGVSGARHRRRGLSDRYGDA